MEVVELLLNLEFNTRLEVILICVFIIKLDVINKIIRLCDLQYLSTLSDNK